MAKGLARATSLALFHRYRKPEDFEGVILRKHNLEISENNLQSCYLVRVLPLAFEPTFLSAP